MKNKTKFIWLTSDNIIKYTSCFLGVIFVFTMVFSFYGRSIEVSGTKTSPEIPIIMYHNVLDNENRVSKYVITPQMFEDDIVYLKQRGYTTILTKDIIDFFKNGTELPQKPVIITFDDGYYNNYSYVYPILKKHNEKAVISVIARHSEEASHDDDVQNNNYSHITWAQAEEMSKSGLVEIQNHSYSMHDLTRRKGVLRKKGEELSHYKEVLINDVMRAQDLIKNGTGTLPVAYTYPFGAVNNDAHSIIKELGFKVTYGCEEGKNIITNDPESLHRLKRYNRSGLESRDKFFERVLSK